MGIWRGDGWLSHGSDVAVLVVIGAVCTLAAAGLFRWEADLYVA